MKIKKRVYLFAALASMIFSLLCGCENADNVMLSPSPSPAPAIQTENTLSPAAAETPVPTPEPTPTPQPFSLSSVPAYSGNPYVAINSNMPYFTENEITSVSYEAYGNHDNLGRCTAASASIGKELMPTGERGKIGQIKPTGWHTVKYDNVDGKYLYNRCHLIGYQLSGENANDRNLITGTRYMNVQGMLPFENMVADYVKETNNHVMYRVTPVFDGSNLLASGVLMEALSVEDNGAGICYNVYCYNVQPGININYGDGSSSSAAQNQAAEANPKNEKVSSPAQSSGSYIGNKNTKKFHYPSCASVRKMNNSNKVPLSSRSEAVSKGYVPCKNCNP